MRRPAPRRPGSRAPARRCGASASRPGEVVEGERPGGASARGHVGAARGDVEEQPRRCPRPRGPARRARSASRSAVRQAPWSRRRVPTHSRRRDGHERRRDALPAGEGADRVDEAEQAPRRAARPGTSRTGLLEVERRRRERVGRGVQEREQREGARASRRRAASAVLGRRASRANARHLLALAADRRADLLVAARRRCARAHGVDERALVVLADDAAPGLVEQRRRAAGCRPTRRAGSRPRGRADPWPRVDGVEVDVVDEVGEQRPGTRDRGREPVRVRRGETALARSRDEDRRELCHDRILPWRGRVRRPVHVQERTRACRSRSARRPLTSSSQNQFGTPVRLSSFRGEKNVVLVFYPQGVHRRPAPASCARSATRARCSRTTTPSSSASRATLPPTLKVFAEQEGYEFAAAQRLLAARRGVAGVRRLLRQGRLPAARHVHHRQGRRRALVGREQPGRRPPHDGLPRGPRRAVADRGPRRWHNRAVGCHTLRTTPGRPRLRAVDLASCRRRGGAGARLPRLPGPTGWTDGLDRCRACGSTALVKRLGEVGCRGVRRASASGVAGPGRADPAHARRGRRWPTTSRPRWTGCCAATPPPDARDADRSDRPQDATHSHVAGGPRPRRRGCPRPVPGSWRAGASGVPSPLGDRRPSAGA